MVSFIIHIVVYQQCKSAYVLYKLSQTMQFPGKIVGNPDSKFHGANMGPIGGRQDPGGPHVYPMSFAVWEIASRVTKISLFTVSHIFLYFLHFIPCIVLSLE